MKIVEQTPTKLILRELPHWTNWVVGFSHLAVGLFAIQFNGFGFIFVASGLFILLRMAELKTHTFDKQMNCIILKRQCLIKTKVMKYLLSEISGIYLKEFTSMHENGRISTIYKPILLLTSGMQVTLASDASLRNKQKVADCIAAFLNVFNYGLEGLAKPTLPQLAFLSYQEEITYWQTATCMNSNDANAYRQLGLALYKLYKQDQTNNEDKKEEAIESLKRAEAIFKAQGDDEDAMLVRHNWQIMR